MKWAIHTNIFWRNVSNATEARTVAQARQFEDNAMRAFADIYNGCVIDQSYDDPEASTMAMDAIKKSPVSSGGVLMDVSDYMPPDIIKRGTRLAELSLSHYVI